MKNESKAKPQEHQQKKSTGSASSAKRTLKTRGEDRRKLTPAEQLAQETQANLRALIENTNASIWSFDRQYRLTAYNTQFAKNTTIGFGQEISVGRNFLEITPEAIREEWRGYYDRCLGGEHFCIETIRSAPLEERVIEYYFNPIVLDNDEIVGGTVFGNDITERKQAEEELRKSEEKWHSLVMSVPDYIAIHDQDDRYLFLNHYAEGFSEKDIAGRSVLDFIAPESRSLFQKNLDEVRKTGEMRKFEYTALGDRGTQREYEQTIVPLAGPKGEIHTLNIARDITERKQADSERQAFEEIMQGLVRAENVSEYLGLVHQTIAKVIVAENFYVILKNKSSGLFEEIYSVDEYDPPAAPARLEKSISSYVFHTGEPLLLNQARFDELIARGEVEMVGVNSLSWLGVPLIASGKTIGVMAVQDYVKDGRYSEREKEFLVSIAGQVAQIIVRKQAEEALREKERRYRTIFEGVEDAIFVETPDGRILDVNRRACEMYGYSHEQFLTKTVKDIVPAAEKIVSVDLHDPDDQLFSHPIETVNIRANGQQFPIELNAHVEKIDDQPVLLVVARDISERKEAEAELAKSREQLRALSQYLVQAREEERTYIAREIHDEFGQALTAIKMDLAWVAKQLPPQQTALLKKTSDMTGMVDSTIQLVRRVASELRPGMLDDLGLAAALEWQAGEFQNRTGIKCKLDVPEDVSMLTLEQATGLFRIFQEALTNIGRHAQATRVNITLKEQPDRIYLLIRDNGIGMSENEINVPRSLGLIGMQERVRALGGTLVIKGTLGKGTTIRAIIPRTKAEVEQEA